ncbi:TPR-like protein [Piromyces finnis]|uniref:TPR-like protein n=1 Tax=Piromyces finnis TaxID=1754191 RepID=A0A1Y1VFU6_9FUNG|nr:TPR-like protein [Piromyces finnis]|eukprot:ORX55297.1 TPR-like protein [Piromyces finnis]
MNESKLSVSPEIPKRETSLPKYTIDELLEQGFVFFSPPINNYLRAINKWMQACSQAYSENDLLKEAKALSNLGCAYRLLGNLKSALEHQWSAWRLTQKLIEDYKKEPKLGSIKKKKAPSNFWVNIIQDVIHEVHSFPSYSDNSQGNNISRNSSSLNYAKFKKYKSIKSGISTPNTISTPSTAVWVMDLLSNIGNTYYTLGNFEEAVKYYNASLSIVERILKKYPLSISNPDSQNGSTQDFFIQSQTNLTTSQSTQQSITQPPSFTDNNINNFSTTTNNAYLQQQQQQLQLQQQQNQFLIKSNSSATSSNVVMTDPKFLNPTTANNGSNKNWKKMFINKSTSENSISSINNNDFSSGGFMEHSISDIKIKQNNKYTYIHRSCIIAKSRALTHLGLCYDAIYDIKKAKNYHQDALSISKNLLKYAPDMEIKNKRETVINLQMNCHNIASPVNLHYASVIANLGNNYYLQSNMNKALSHFYLALNIFDWENDKLASRKLNINIGSTWINCGKLFIQGSWWQDNELQNNHMDNRNELPKNYVKITSTEESKIYINKGISLINENVNALDKNDWISKVFFATNFGNLKYIK